MTEHVKKAINKMSGLVLEMANLIYEGFMKNDAHYLNSALNKERIIDDLEKEIICSAMHDKEFIITGQVAQNLERMGDEMRYLIERIEIKIVEKLLFSDLGVEQYKEVFNAMLESVNMTNKFLAENDTRLLDQILENGKRIKKLIEEYRVQHLQRLAKGICEPRAANMYFDMLDFTGNIARHCTNIARACKEK